MKRQFNALKVAFFVCAIASCGSEPALNDKEKENGEVNVFSHRYYESDKELFRKFEKKTGIKVNVKEADDDEMIALLQSDGAYATADVMITVDAGRLYFAKKLGLLQPLQSPVLNENIPEYLRDPQNEWFGLTQRARVVVYNKKNVKLSELSTYEDLAHSKWKGQIFVRSSDNIYNQSLLASMIAHKGPEYAENWARAIVANMAREPKGNDRDQIKEVAAGHGNIAIVNSYYLGKLLFSENEMERKAMENVGIFFPDQETWGTHMNVSGAGIMKHAAHLENARKLIEFLSSDEAQGVFAESNYEYPAKVSVRPSALLQSWGQFRGDTLNLSLLGKYNRQAVEIFKKAGWN